MSFGQLVVEYRQRSGLTQEELAERSGLSVRGIRDVEAGRVRSPRRESLRLLADAFGLVGADRDRFQQVGRGGTASIAAAGPGADGGSALGGGAGGGIRLAAVVVGEPTLVLIAADQEIRVRVAALSEDGRRLIDVGVYEPDEALRYLSARLTVATASAEVPDGAVGTPPRPEPSAGRYLGPEGAG